MSQRDDRQSRRLRRRSGRPGPGAARAGGRTSQHAYLLVHEPSQGRIAGRARRRRCSSWTSSSTRRSWRWRSRRAGSARPPRAARRARRRRSTPAPQPSKLTLEMFFDASGKQDTAWSSGREALHADCVPTETSLTAKKASPPWVIFRWGSLTGFLAYVSQVQAKYTLFTAGGPADPGHLPGHARGAGRRRRRSRTRRPAASCRTACTRWSRATASPAIAYREYGDSRRCGGAVAELNGVDDPMRLRAGHRLLLPPLEELALASHRRPSWRGRAEGSMAHGEEFSNTLLVKVDGTPLPGRRQAAAGRRLRRRQHQRARPVRAAVLRRRRHRAREGADRDRREGRAAASSPPRPAGRSRCSPARSPRWRWRSAGRASTRWCAGLDTSHRLFRGTPGRGLPQHDRLRHRAQGRAAGRTDGGQGRRDGRRSRRTPARTASTTGTSCAGWPPSTDAVLGLTDGRWSSPRSRRRRRTRRQAARESRDRPAGPRAGASTWSHLRGTVTSGGAGPGGRGPRLGLGAKQAIVAAAPAKTGSAAPGGGLTPALWPRRSRARRTSLGLASLDQPAAARRSPRRALGPPRRRLRRAGGYGARQPAAAGRHGRDSWRRRRAVRRASTCSPPPGTSSPGPRLPDHASARATPPSGRLRASPARRAGAAAGRGRRGHRRGHERQGPRQQGRVKMKLPWLADAYESVVGAHRPARRRQGPRRRLSCPRSGTRCWWRSPRATSSIRTSSAASTTARTSRTRGWAETSTARPGADACAARFVSRTGMVSSSSRTPARRASCSATNGGAQKIVLTPDRSEGQSRSSPRAGEGQAKQGVDVVDAASGDARPQGR